MAARPPWRPQDNPLPESYPWPDLSKPLPHLPPEVILTILSLLDDDSREVGWDDRGQQFNLQPLQKAAQNALRVLELRLVCREWNEVVRRAFRHPQLILSDTGGPTMLESLPSPYPFRIEKLSMTLDAYADYDFDLSTRCFKDCQVASLYMDFIDRHASPSFTPRDLKHHLLEDPWRVLGAFQDVEEYSFSANHRTKCSQESLQLFVPLRSLTRIVIHFQEWAASPTYLFDAPFLFPSSRQLPQLRSLALADCYREGQLSSPPHASQRSEEHRFEQRRILHAAEHLAPQLTHLSLMDWNCTENDDFFAKLDSLEALEFEWFTSARRGWTTPGITPPSVRIMALAFILNAVPNAGKLKSLKIIDQLLQVKRIGIPSPSPMWLPYLVQALASNLDCLRGLKELWLEHRLVSSSTRWQTLRSADYSLGWELSRLCFARGIRVFERSSEDGTWRKW